MSTNIVAWNCRGMGRPRKQQFLPKMLLSTKAKIAFLSETKCSHKKTKKILQTLPLTSNAYVPSRGRSGGLWLVWDPSIKLQIIQKSHHLIIAHVLPADSASWLLVCIYGDPAHHHNHIDIYGAVCVIGDFNAILHESEKLGGNPILNRNNQEFRNFVFEAGLQDLGYKGPAYTWTNRQNTSSAIYERLDRVLVTVGWAQLFPEAYVNHLPHIHSDHAAILLRLKKQPPRPKTFKIENWWFQTDGFREAWEEGWINTRDQNWEDRMITLRGDIGRWCSERQSPQKELQELERQILIVLGTLICMFAHKMTSPVL